MKKETLKIIGNERLTHDAFAMTFEGCSYVKPGSFVELRPDGFFLARPFGAGDYADNKLTIFYRVVGEGTEAMTSLKAGKEISALTGLGNGFRTERAKRPLLVGGGLGVAPLYYLAKDFAARGIRPTVIAGFRSARDVILRKEFEKVADFIVTTDDGTEGYRGNAVSYLKNNSADYDYYYACGPTVMLKYLTEFALNGEVSLEARMGCGFGACMGCSIMTRSGSKRVCKEGPVFDAAEVIL